MHLCPCIPPSPALSTSLACSKQPIYKLLETQAPAITTITAVLLSSMPPSAYLPGTRTIAQPTLPTHASMSPLPMPLATPSQDPPIDMIAYIHTRHHPPVLLFRQGRSRSP
jgi:hypothetical protein